MKNLSLNGYSLYSVVCLCYMSKDTEESKAVNDVYVCVNNLQVLDWTELVAHAGHQLSPVQYHLRRAVCCTDAAQSQIAAVRRALLQSLWPRQQRLRQKPSGLL